MILVDPDFEITNTSAPGTVPITALVFIFYFLPRAPYSPPFNLWSGVFIPSHFYFFAFEFQFET